MKKRTKNTRNPKEPKLHPVHETFFDQFPSEEYGTGVITGYWKVIFLLIPFSLYFLSLFESTIMIWSMFSLSIFLILGSILVIYGFNKDMLHNINPFDYVTFQFINIVCVAGHFSFTYYFLHILFPCAFNNLPASYELIDYFILSIGAITTAGSTLIPSMTISKIMTLTELGIGIWFLVTIIPLAIGYQAERTRQFIVAKKKHLQELDKAIKNGDFIRVDTNKSNNKSNNK
jgi:hypothetical protein